ncbi:MAG: insulinase family protein [Deltaproteobacteria bacterium]|nr:insulinase family protein [Deltaproteobacteria bacterium]
MSRIRNATLGNGITVLTEEMADIGSVTLGVWIKNGSRHENSGEGGLSHFIEHLLFKGTKRRDSIDIAREVESVGGVINAFTSLEYTCFYVKLLSKDLPMGVDLLSDIVINSRFAEKEIERERGVILQEIKMVEDTPDDLIHDLFLKTLWKGQAMGRPVLGEAEDISSFTRKDILSYYKNAYHPSSIIISVAGNFKHRKLLRLIDDVFGGMMEGPTNGAVTAPLPVSGVNLQRRNLEQVHLCLGVPTVSRAHNDRYKLYLLSTILGGGMGSRFFQEIREKRGLAYSVYSYLHLHRDVGNFVVYVGTSSDSFTKVIRLILKGFKDISDSIGRKELSIAKEQFIGNMMLGLESSENRMSKLAKDEIYYGRVVPFDEIASSIRKVSGSSLRNMANSIFRPGAFTLAALGDVEEKGLPRALKSRRVN